MSATMNANLDWSRAFVAELANCGLQAVCLAPGSRSTPLALAFYHHPDVRVYLHLDERSAAFFALGMALATQRPVALVCTSGTASAEFHPALVEARQSQVPLLVLTADRPHELRHSGANQTIDQVKMYGDHVLWSVDAPVPQIDAPALVLRHIQTLACRAYAVADGLVKGPVHVNLPFRKPLEPDAAEALTLPSRTRPAVRMERGTVQPSPSQIEALAELIQGHPHGLIVCGPHCPLGEFPAAATQLAHTAGYPLLADSLSGLRFGPQVGDAPISGAYDLFLAGSDARWPAPEIVLRFGSLPTSATLATFLQRNPPSHLIHVRQSGVWADDSHRVDSFLQADETVVCRQLVAALHPRAPSRWSDQFLSKEADTWAQAESYLEDAFFDGSAVATVVRSLPKGTNLVVSNSLPVRLLDQLGRPRPERIPVFANRGASGIDGVTSTALGIAAGTGSPTVLITGDIAFYHDLNGLLAIKQHDLQRIAIVLLNNNGGGIFRRLPIAKLEPAFTSLFLTPHGLGFEHAAQLYGLGHCLVDDERTLKEALARSLTETIPQVIEVRTDSAQDLEHQRRIVQMANGA